MLVGRGMGISRPLVLELVLGGSVCGLLRAQRGRGRRVYRPGTLLRQAIFDMHKSSNRSITDTNSAGVATPKKTLFA